MGAVHERDPFGEEGAPPPAPAFVLHSQEALKEMQELLELVQHWRVKYEALADEKHLRLQRWRRQHGK